MNRKQTAVFATALVVFLGATQLEAAPGGGGGGGRSVGGGGGRSLGGGGGRSIGGGGSALRAAPSVRSFGGVRSGPSLSGPSLGGFRAAPSAGGPRSVPSISSLRPPASIGGARVSPSIGSLNPARVSPSIGGQRTPSANLGPLNRPNLAPSSGSALGRVRPSVVVPNTRPAAPGSGNANRATINGLGQNALRPGQTGARTTLRPLAPGNPAAGAIIARPAPVTRVNPPVVSRVTPQHLNRHLAIPSNRHLTGASGALAPAAHTVWRPTGHFKQLNATQVVRINRNIHQGFHQHHGLGVNRGFGFGSFGFGFGSPYWHNWACGVRSYWSPVGYGGLFTPRFWATNHCYFPWRRSYYWWGGYPSSYWWNAPSWGGLTSWFPSYGWSTPYYYGYGPGGNIVYSGDSVLVNDVPLATAADYAASAAALAEVPPPANPDQPTQWLPLGTFALSASESDMNPVRVVQLAVDKEGIVSGTMFNKETNQTYPVQGRVDKETQRVAFTIGDAKEVVFETGIYNLTQQQTPVLAHGEGREETYLLLRLEAPKESGAAAAAPAASPSVPPGPPSAAPPPIQP